MRHPRLLLLATLSLSALAAPLVAQNTPSTSAPATLPSVTLPPELDRVLRDYEKAWRAGDAATLSNLFAEDGFVLQNGRAPVRGRAAIKSAYTGQGGGQLRLRALAYAVADSVGYIVGAFGFGDAPGDQGKFTLTLRRPRGATAWLIFSDMDNPNQPPRRPGTP